MTAYVSTGNRLGESLSHVMFDIADYTFRWKPETKLTFLSNYGGGI